VKQRVCQSVTALSLSQVVARWDVIRGTEWQQAIAKISQRRAVVRQDEIWRDFDLTETRSCLQADRARRWRLSV
jgi:hypothetical protein